MSAGQVEHFVAAIESEFRLLGSQVSAGQAVALDDIVRVYGAKAQILQALGRIDEAIQVVEAAGAILEQNPACEPSAALRMRSMLVPAMITAGSIPSALRLLDELYDEWSALGNTESMASVKWDVMSVYSTTGQPKLAWSIFIQHIELFDQTILPGTTPFIASVIEIADSLGKLNESILLQHWLALVEDMEWEPNPARQARNQSWFEDYRASVGGLRGLLEVEV